MDNECGTGLFCNSQTLTCNPLKETYEICSRDEECKNSMACANKQCIPYGSLEVNEVSDNALSCRSGFIRNFENDSQPICVASPRILNK